MEGCVETSRPGLDGQRVPRSLDDVRAGRTKYVTLASDPSNYGKYFHLGTISYLSAEDKQKHTVQNVIGYVHDTGGAFKGKPKKIDVNTTICKNCSDAQASAMAAGKNVSYIPSSQGLVDPVSGNTGYGNVLSGDSQPGAGTAPTGVQGGTSNSSGTPGTGGSSGTTTPTVSSNDPKTKPTGVDGGGVGNPLVPKDDVDTPVSNELISVTCEKNIISWACSSGATRVRGKSKPYDRTFKTKGDVSGEITVHPRVKTLYTITCYNNAKKIDAASCTILGLYTAKSKLQMPRLTLTVDHEHLRRGEHTHVTWSALHVKNCFVTGQGVQQKGPTGSVDTEAFLKRGTFSVTLRCESLEGKEVRLKKDIRVD
jgi:3D (Asp-Asp-Asp) domain-containing protein